MPPQDAASVADALAWADLRGTSSQGLAKLPIIVDRLRAGGNATRPNVMVRHETPATILFDAEDERGHASGVLAMRVAIAKAKACGVGNNGSPLLRPWALAAPGRSWATRRTPSAAQADAQRERDGVPYPDECLATLRALGDQLGVPW